MSHRGWRCSVLLGMEFVGSITTAFTPVRQQPMPSQRFVNRVPSLFTLWNAKEWTSDFDDYDIGGDAGYTSSNLNKSSNNDKFDTDTTTNQDDDDNDSTLDLTNLLLRRRTMDYSATQSRLFSLGPDMIITDYVGSMGFDEVTDWEYYYTDEDDPQERQVVQPNPFDSSKPKRTRTSSGSVVRVFRGQFVGQLGGLLSAQGLDRRVLVKEFTGKLATKLAQAELVTVGKLQSILLGDDKDAQDGNWIKTASARSVQLRQDNANVATLLRKVNPSPFLGILGEVNLAELDDNWDPNEFYRALSVKPPAPDAVWVVYEYAGLSTIQSYALPGEVRRSRLPPKRGIFGGVVAPPALPVWKDRAQYVVRGIIKGAIEAVATLHENGLVHRSIGRSSLLISSRAMDKTEASSPYAVSTTELRVKLADFGFSGMYQEATMDPEFLARARSFNLFFQKGENSVTTANFAIAEDMHALGFVFMNLLLSSLAEIRDPAQPIPATDEDTLQRLFTDIFDKDMDQFREYVEAEEMWSSLVALLDDKDGAGWKVLETLLLAREKVAKNKETDQIFTVRGVLSNPFFG